MAPISTPRVGWPTISTPGSCSISRASTIFCWLPPEKLAVFSRAVGRADVVFLDLVASASARMASMSRNGPVQILRLVVIAEDGVLAFLEGQHQADMVAVLRHMGEARGRAVRRDRHAPVTSIGLPSSMTRARHRRARMPAIASSSSDWPLPATPAMPTISPARTSKETSSTIVTPRAVPDRQVAAPRA